VATMLTLFLLRHAKSSWDHPGLDDLVRPLNERGRTAAPLMGRYMARHHLVPELVLCSASVRTRATLDLIKPALGVATPEVAYEDGLYLASATDLMARLRSVSPRWPRVLMIGHNPGFHDLAVKLTGTGERKAIAALTAKFPTAALAVLTFEATSWAKTCPGSGRLVHFMTPALLQDGHED
jgi:phosphohistidine phosphatase